MPLNMNQFEQVPVRGQLDLKIMQTGVIECLVSSSQSDALVAGDAVQLNTPAGSKFPTVIEASESQDADGFVVFDPKKASPEAGDVIQMALVITGPVMWMQAGAAISAGDAVEQEADGDVITRTSGKKRGMAIDPAAAAGDLIRVMIFSTVSA